MAFASLIVFAAPAVPAASQARYDWGDPVLAREAESCSYFVYNDADSYAGMHRQGMTQAQADAHFVAKIDQNSETQSWCLRNLKGRFPAQSDLLERAAAASKADLTAAYRAGRAGFLANPGKYVWAGKGDFTAEKLNAAIGEYRRLKSAAQLCGTFDYSIPPIDNKIIQRRDAQRRAYTECLGRYGLNGFGPSVMLDTNLQMLRQELDSFSPYRCSVRKQPGCIDDALWRRYDAIASAENISMAKRLNPKAHEEVSTAMREIGRANDWLRAVNQAVAQYNRSR